MARFLQFHLTTPYAASLLNRDDAGFAKRITWGDSERTRISSQCLKRHWRLHKGPEGLADIDTTVRSRYAFEHGIVEPLIEARGASQTDAIRDVTIAVAKTVLGFNAERAKAKAARMKTNDDSESDPRVRTDQVVVFGKPELTFLAKQVSDILDQLPANPDDKKIEAAVKNHFDRDAKKNLEALAMGAGLSAALFGRMVTSDILARCDAAIHVAHAFTVHEEASESEFFSAVDDLVAEKGELGSGHIGNTELAAGLFYTYVAVDVRKLIENVSDDTEMAKEVIRRLVVTMATVSPGAKKGSTAPYAYASLVLAEAGDAQPCSHAAAFAEAVSTLKNSSPTGDQQQATQAKLANHITKLDAMYGPAWQRQVSAMDLHPDHAKAIGATSVPLKKLAEWAAAQIERAA